MDSLNDAPGETRTGDHTQNPDPRHDEALPGSDTGTGPEGAEQSKSEHPHYTTADRQAEAQRFLNILDPEADTFCFQTFDDDKERKTQALARTMPGTLTALWTALDRMNQQGAGIFVTVNEVEAGKPRKTEHVIRTRAVFADFDPPKTAAAPERYPLPPVMEVESSPGKRHTYWTVDGLPVDGFKAQQRSIVGALDSDPAPCDLPRVMRLPGFFHMKDRAAAHLVRLAVVDERLPYTAAEIAAAFPPVAEHGHRERPRVDREPATETADAQTIRDLRSALLHLRADDRELWVKLGHALKGLGDAGRGLWLDWSATSEKFDAADASRTWEGFQPTQTGFKAVFKAAQDAGWVNPGHGRRPRTDEPPPREDGDPGPAPEDRDTGATDKIADAVAILNAAIEQQATDPGAVFTPAAVDAWNSLYDHDPAEFERLRKRAKQLGARVTEIDKQVGARNKRVRGKAQTDRPKSYTSYTSNTGNDLEQDNPTPPVHEVQDGGIPCARGALVQWGESGPKLLIASDAALVTRDAMRGRYARSTEAASWHRYTGTHWAPAPSAAEVHQALTAWLYPATDPAGFTPRFQDSILTLIERGNMLSLPDAKPGVLPFRNGLLDIATGELLPVSAATAETWCLPYDHTPGADCPTVRAWLTAAVDGDAPTVELLRTWWAALITGRADLQKFLHLPGPGGTGKGVFMRISEALVGAHNTASTDLRTLEQNRFEAATLYRKRLVLISDTDKYGGSVNVLKALTGQDSIRIERKNIQQTGSFRFDGQVLIASNEALATTDLTSGLERRRITVDFRRQASDSEREAWRAKGGEQGVLHQELPGIVNWVLALTPEQVSSAITAPPDRTQASNLAALTAGNPVAGWLVECCAPEAGVWTQIGAKDDRRSPTDGEVYFKDAETMLYPSYLAWSRRTGREPLAQRRFRHVTADMARTLGASVLEVRRSEGQGIQGLRLIRHGDEPHPWSIGRSSVGSVGSGASVQDETVLEPAPVQEVQDMQDFGDNSDFAHARAHTYPADDTAEVTL